VLVVHGRICFLDAVDSCQKYGMFLLSESGFQEMTISKQLLLSFLTVGVGAIGIVSYFFYHDARNALIDRAFEQLTSVKTLKKTKLQDLFAALSERASQLASMADLEARLQNPKEREALSRNLETLVVLDSTGKVALGQLPCPIVPIASRADSIIISDLFFCDSAKSPVFYVGARLKGKGWILLVQSFDVINKVLTERSGLGESGESYLVGSDFIMRSNSRFFSTPTVLNLYAKTDAVEAAFRGERTPMIVKDYRGIEVLSSFSVLEFPMHKWAILSEIDYAEVLVPIDAMRRRVVLIACAVSAVLIAVSLVVARTLSQPIQDISARIEQVSVGNLTASAFPNTRIAELNAMATSVSRLIDALHRTRLFATEIGNGNFEATFEPLSEQDETGRSLLKMQSELKRLMAFAEKERALRTASLLEGEESERNRISRELHDGLGQILTAIKFQAQSLPPSEKRDELMDLLDDAIDEVRRLSYNLMPRVLMDFGLNAALQKLVSQTAERADITIHFDNTLDTERRFDEQLEIGIFRIAQEAMNNALKHAEASQIHLALAERDSRLYLTICDNGKGFNLNALAHQNGLRNMHERAKLLGGTCTITTNYHEGTRIEVTLPMTNQNSP
jgi:two-component system NarL family sensor kinase